MFFPACLSVNSRLQAEAPEITQAKPMSYASSGRALPLCPYSHLLLDVCHVWVFWSIVILYICNTHYTKQVFSVLSGNSWSLPVF